jgi:4-hydroxy-tetrahydrodipicolinate reductase
MLVELISAADDMLLASMVERTGHPDFGKKFFDVTLDSNLQEALTGVDVLLDFSLPDSVVEHARLAAEKKIPQVTGVTGFSSEQWVEINQVASKIPVVCSSNMSKGVFVLTKLVAKAAELLGSAYDAEIVEIHHRNKIDSPSGTALQLATAIETQRGGRTVYERQGKREPGEIGLSAVRGGDVVGEHQVLFLGPGEQIILNHRATTREHFCRGALDAVRFVIGRPCGLYGMQDVFSQ